MDNKLLVAVKTRTQATVHMHKYRYKYREELNPHLVICSCQLLNSRFYPAIIDEYFNTNKKFAFFSFSVLIEARENFLPEISVKLRQLNKFCVRNGNKAVKRIE